MRTSATKTIQTRDITRASGMYIKRLQEATGVWESYIAKLDEAVSLLHLFSLRQSLKDKDAFVMGLYDYVNSFVLTDDTKTLSKYREMFLTLMAHIDNKSPELISMEMSKVGVIAWFKNKVEKWYLEGEVSDTTAELILGHEKLEELGFKKHFKGKYARK